MNKNQMMSLLGLTLGVLSTFGMDMSRRDPSTGLLLAPENIVALGIEAQRAVGVPEALLTAIFVETPVEGDVADSDDVVKRTNSFSDKGGELAYTTATGCIFVKPLLLNALFGVKRFSLFHEAIHKLYLDAQTVAANPQKRAMCERRADTEAARVCRCQDCIYGMSLGRLPITHEIESLLVDKANRLGEDGADLDGYLTQLSLLAQAAKIDGFYCVEHARLRDKRNIAAIADDSTPLSLARLVSLSCVVCHAKGDAAFLNRLSPAKERLKLVFLWLAPKVLSPAGKEDMLRKIGFIE